MHTKAYLLLLDCAGLLVNMRQMLGMLTQVDGWLPTMLVVNSAVLNTVPAKATFHITSTDFTNAMLQVRSHIFTLDAGLLLQLKQKENFLCLKIKINL
jgi:hypothetical protein